MFSNYTLSWIKQDITTGMAKEKGIELHFLLPYSHSPNLNAIERL